MASSQSTNAPPTTSVSTPLAAPALAAAAAAADPRPMSADLKQPSPAPPRASPFSAQQPQQPSPLAVPQQREKPKSPAPQAMSSPAPTMASMSSSSGMTPLQQFAAPPQNGTAQGARGNGGSRPSTATSSDDREAKRVKTEHDSSAGVDGSSAPPMGGFMGYPGGNMPMMMPGFGPGMPPGSMPPGSMLPNGFPPNSFAPAPGMMPGYPTNYGNGNGQYGFPHPYMQMPGYGGPPGPAPGQMGPPFMMPPQGFPTGDQQHAGSSGDAGPSTPAQQSTDGSTPKAAKPKKPRVKKEPGEKPKTKTKKQAAAEESNGNGNAGQDDTPQGSQQLSPSQNDAGQTQGSQTPQQQPEGQEPKKEKGKRGPKTDKTDKPKKPRKKKDKAGEGGIDVTSSGATPAATPGPSSAIPDEISAVQSLLASAGALPQQGLAGQAEASTSAMASAADGSAAGGAAGMTQANGAAAPTAGPAVEASGDNVDSLQDLLGMSGVDLQAEEEAIHTGNSAPQPLASAATASAALESADALDGRPSPFYLELYALSYRIHRRAARNGLRVEPEVLMYLSNAAKMRCRNLLEAMVSASRHRAWSSHLRPPPLFERSNKPMYHEELLDDPQKLLSALTRVEKAEEQSARQRRMLREEQEANAAAGIATGEADVVDDGGGSGAVSGTQTPGTASGKKASAKNMSDDKRLKLANKTAAQALGITSTSKSWMFGSGAGGNGSSGFGSSQGSGPSRLPKPRFAPQPSESSTAKNRSNGRDGEAGDNVKGENGVASQAGNNPGGWGDLTARRRHREEEERRRARLVNMDDALHALEMERSGGAGRGSGERTLYMTRALGRPFIAPKQPPSSGL